MQENKFEKQVQQQLQNLQLEPTPPVWEAVHARIQPQRRRRRLLLWWLPVLLLVGGGWLWWQGNLNSSGKNENTGVLPKNDKSQKDITYTLPSNKRISTIKKEKEQGKQQSNTTLLHQNVKQPQVENRIVDIKALGSKKRSQVFPGKKTAVVTLKAHNTNPSAVTAETETIPATIALQEKSAANSTVVANQNIPIKIPNSSTLISDSSNAVVSKQKQVIAGGDTAMQQPATNVITQQKNNRPSGKKASWVLQIAGGATTVNAGVLDANKSANIYNAPVLFSPAAVPLAPVYMAPQQPRYDWGLAISAGASWQKPLSARTKISAGLLYRYNTISLQAVRGGDSAVLLRGNAVQNYIISRNEAVYHNRYHQIEVPLAFGYQPFRKVNVWVWHGVGPAVVAAHRTVLFDAQNTATRDAASGTLNRWQWVLNSSVQTSLKLPKGNRLLLGPSVRYQPSALFKTGQQNLLEISFGANLPLPTKK